MKPSMRMTQAGKCSIDHNRRSHKEWNPDGHIDRDRTPLNVTLHDVNVDQVLEDLFDEPLHVYNEKIRKKHPERIKSLSKTVSESKKEIREALFQFGNENEQPEDYECVDLLTEQFERFKSENPNFLILHASIHMDETTPHMHVDYLPISHPKKGMSVKVSMEGALKEQGEQTNGNILKFWTERMRDLWETKCAGFCMKNGYNFEPSERTCGKDKKKHIEYYEKSLIDKKKEYEELEKKHAALKSEIEGLQTKIAQNNNLLDATKMNIESMKEYLEWKQEREQEILDEKEEEDRW